MDVSHCFNAFRGLREVNIAASEFGADGWMTGNFAKILSAATDLQTLAFFFGYLDLSLFHKTRFRHYDLTCLIFSAAGFYQGELLDLLRRHSATLLEVQLLDIHLINGSWTVLLEGMKSYLSLQNIRIDWSTEEDDDEGEEVDVVIEQSALQKYLGDGPHPLS